MPYTKDNPPERIKGLPEHAQAIWIAAFNNALKEYKGDEEKANATAWAAVKKAGYEKNKEGKWVKMAEGKFKCECLACGHKLESEEHCADIKCPKCGGVMRREERPGPGQFSEPNFEAVPIFKTGKFPPDTGDKGTYSEHDLDEIVATFNPSIHEPPATLDHIQDGPAFAWVEKLWRTGDTLYAKFKEVSSKLKELVKTGAYKKRSIELWPNFEGTGKLVLKAVTWLGARAPQVKGLANQYNDAHGEIFCLPSDGTDNQPAEHMEEDMEMKEVQKMLDEQKAGFDKQFTAFKEETDAKIKTLADENAELKKTQATKFSEEALEKKRLRVHGEVASLLKEGRITPAYVDAGIEQFLMAQPEDAKVIFGEGEDKKEIPVLEYAIDLFANKVKGAPIHFGELTKDGQKPGNAMPQVLRFHVMDDGGDDTVVSKDSVELSTKADAYAKEHKVSFREGLVAVSRD